MMDIEKRFIVLYNEFMEENYGVRAKYNGEDFSADIGASASITALLKLLQELMDELKKTASRDVKI